MWDPVGKKPTHVEEATADQKILWSDRYRWDNPFEGYEKYVIKKECPGEESWGYWPGLGRKSGLCNQLQTTVMLNVLKSCNAPIRDLDSSNATDLAIRLCDVLDSQYDIHGPLSNSNMSTYKRNKDPILAADITSLKCCVSLLKEEKCSLLDELQASVSLTKLNHISSSIQSIQSFLCDIRYRVKEFEIVFKEFSCSLMKGINSISLQMCRLRDELSSSSETANELSHRLNSLTTTAILVISKGESVLRPIGLPAITEDCYVLGNDKFTPIVSKLFKNYQERKKTVPTATIPAKASQVDPSTFLKTDVEHFTVALGLIRLSRGLSEMTTQFAMSERRLLSLEHSPIPVAAVEEPVQVKIETKIPEKQKELSLMEKLELLEPQLHEVNPVVNSDVVQFLKRLNDKFNNSSQPSINNILKSTKAVQRAATFLLMGRKKNVENATMMERDKVRDEKLKKRLADIRHNRTQKIEQTLDGGAVPPTGRVVQFGRSSPTLGDQLFLGELPVLSRPSSRPVSTGSPPSPCLQALPPLLGFLSKKETNKAVLSNFGQTVMSLNTAAGILRQ